MPNDKTAARASDSTGTAPFLSPADIDRLIERHFPEIHFGGKTIFIDAKWYPEPEFAAKMREFGERSASKDVLIKADKQLTYGDVKKVMKMIKDGGFEKIALITERKTEE